MGFKFYQNLVPYFYYRFLISHRKDKQKNAKKKAVKRQKEKEKKQFEVDDDIQIDENVKTKVKIILSAGESGQIKELGSK